MSESVQLDLSMVQRIETDLMEGKLTLEAVNNMDYHEFITAFCSVIEHGTLAAATVWSGRPFSSQLALHQAFVLFLSSLPPQSKLGVVRCYPDLAGKSAGEGGLTEESHSEHKAAGLLELSKREMEEMVSLNDSYKEKFSFPFVICARENKKEAIMKGTISRLENSVAEEVDNALAEISKIAYHRITNILHVNSGQNSRTGHL